MRGFADRLIAFETGRADGSKTKESPPLFVDDKLRPQLTMLMGSVGFRALLSRALVLAVQEIAWLGTVRVKADGSLEQFDEAGQMSPKEIAEGNAILFAQLLGLLVAFIGEKLTLQLVHDAWPELSFDDWDLGSGVENEKAD